MASLRLDAFRPRLTSHLKGDLYYAFCALVIFRESYCTCNNTMHRAKFILDLLQKKEENSMQITVSGPDDEASKTFDVDDLFLNKDLYESAPASEQIYPNLPSIKPPNSAPLLTDTGNDFISSEDILSEKDAPSEQQLQNFAQKPHKSPFSDISGIEPLSSSPEPDFSDSGDSWYPDSEEDRKKKQVVIRSSSSDSSDFCDYSKRKKYNKTQVVKPKPGCSKDDYGCVSNNIVEDVETESNQQQNTTTSLVTVEKNQESREADDQSSSTASILNNEKQLTRWKKSDPSKWKKNIANINRHKCLPYHGKKGNIIMPAKKPKHVNCIEKCRFQCTSHFSEDDRVKLCEDYWKIDDYVSQKQFLLCQIVAKPIKTMKAGIPNEKHRSATYEYYFSKDDQQHRVCKDFFLKTLCISNGPVNEAIKYKNEFGHYEGQDRRGSRAPVNKTDAASEQKIIDHINSFPRLESHYCRKKSKRQYLDSTLSISKMYELYQEELVTAGEQPCSFYVYKRIFGSQFNLSFFKPKKDLCIICTRYDSSGRPESLKEEYDAHIARKNAAQDAKESDKQRSMNDDTYLVVTADMQSTLHIPVSGVGILYYTRKLNVQNYTIYTAKPPNEVFCITWNEINGKRGSIEIASAMNWWIHQIPACVKEVTIYSDTCAGQNRNKFITAFLCHLIVRPDVHVEILEQKYLESGHTHMEVDSMHSAIEKCQRNTPVFSMIDWKSIMVRARSKRHRNSAPPYVVKEMTYNDMIDVKDLSEHFLRNTSKDKEGRKIMWLKIKCLRFEKQHPGLVKFRYTHDGPYSEFDIFQTLDKVTPRATRRTKRALDDHAIEENEDKIDQLKEYVIPKAYSSPIPISEAKKKDLLNLCTKGIIPQELHSWYETLPTGKDIVDRLCEPDVAEEGKTDLDF